MFMGFFVLMVAAAICGFLGWWIPFGLLAFLLAADFALLPVVMAFATYRERRTPIACPRCGKIMHRWRPLDSRTGERTSHLAMTCACGLERIQRHYYSDAD